MCRFPSNAHRPCIVKRKHMQDCHLISGLIEQRVIYALNSTYTAAAVCFNFDMLSIFMPFVFFTQTNQFSIVAFSISLRHISFYAHSFNCRFNGILEWNDFYFTMYRVHCVVVRCETIVPELIVHTYGFVCDFFSSLF